MKRLEHAPSCGQALSPLLASLILILLLAPALRAETLYNGIVLPTPWPPVVNNPYYDLNHCYPTLQTPYYLVNPPSVIPIDVGRQLFVDSFLIQSNTLTVTHHLPNYYSGNPVLTPQGGTSQYAEQNTSMIYSDGVWFDPNTREFNMFYARGLYSGVVYSKDCLTWERRYTSPYWPNTNICWVQGAGWCQRDSAVMWLDPNATDPNWRWRVAYWRGSFHNAISADGIVWHTTLIDPNTHVLDGGDDVAGHPNSGDRSTFFYNPFRNKWCFSFRYGISDTSGLLGVRGRKYWETTDWTQKSPDCGGLRWWWCADANDLPDPRYGEQTELYNLDLRALREPAAGPVHGLPRRLSQSI